MDNYISRLYAELSNEGVGPFFLLIARAVRVRTNKLRHLLRQHWHRIRCPDAVADPCKIIHVSPDDVERVAAKGLMSKPILFPIHATHIVAGEWDRPESNVELKYLARIENGFDDYGTVPIEKYLFYRSVRNHVRHGRAWTDTEFYRWMTSTDDPPASWEYSNEQGRQWRFEQLDRLADSMREDGYRTQRECETNSQVPAGHDVFDDNLYPDDVPPECKEVAVNIGRNGTLILSEGRHRFSVARSLELDRIPVRVFVRHARWQKRREEVVRASCPGEVSTETRRYLSHPDMADVASGTT